MSRINLLGYDNLGDKAKDGLRYAWNFCGSKYLLESAAFINKTKGVCSNISGYTTSVGLGCILRHFGCSCTFCRTGNLLPFVSLLTAEEIAKQNIVMVLTDLNCSEHEELRTNKREFAYMGQGEPGYSYSQIRLAIKITDYVMGKLGQNVYRHIISTSGIVEMLHAFKADLESKYYDSRITMHFSLHSSRSRDNIMPINVLYPYDIVIKELKKISDVSDEKICLGMLLFNSFRPKDYNFEYTTKIEDIDEILLLIDPEHFRFSFCQYNDSSIATSKEFSLDEADRICDYVRNKGYEAKLFSSFGQKENTACGMLAGEIPVHNISSKWIELEKYAEELITEALMNV